MRYATQFGFYELNPFPGCNQLVVSNHSFIFQMYRGEGKGYSEHYKRLEEARRLGYDAIICTVRDDNVPQIKILTHHEWTKCFEFNNEETGHRVQVWMKDLSHMDFTVLRPKKKKFCQKHEWCIKKPGHAGRCR
jgi:hypothetical protein